MSLLKESDLSEVMDNVEYEAMTQEEGLNKFIGFLYDSQFRGKLFMDGNKKIEFIHDRRINDFMNSGGNWFIKIPEASSYTEETKVSYIQECIEIDNKMIQFLVKEFNQGIIDADQRDFFWKKYLLKESAKVIRNSMDLHTQKYYTLDNIVRANLAYSWCLGKGKGLEYVEYLKKSLKNAISHNDFE